MKTEELDCFFELLGYDKAYEICKKLQKTRIYIPKDKEKMDKNLRSVFGKSFDMVHKEFWGTMIYFPAIYEEKKVRQNIRDDYWKNNMTFFQIAKKYARTVDTIRKICKTKVEEK